MSGNERYGPKRGSTNEGLVAENAGVVKEISGGDVVGAVQDDVVFGDEFQCIGAGNLRLMRDRFARRIQPLAGWKENQLDLMI